MTPNSPPSLLSNSFIWLRCFGEGHCLHALGKRRGEFSHINMFNLIYLLEKNRTYYFCFVLREFPHIFHALVKRHRAFSFNISIRLTWWTYRQKTRRTTIFFWEREFQHIFRIFFFVSWRLPYVVDVGGLLWLLVSPLRLTTPSSANQYGGF